MKSSRPTLVRRADTLFSLAIRLRDKRTYGGRCPFGCGQIECVFHWVTRSKHIVRWDPENATGTCAASNFRYEFDPHKFIQWYRRTHGEAQYDGLLRRCNATAKYSAQDLRDIVGGLKAVVERGGDFSHFHLPSRI